MDYAHLLLLFWLIQQSHRLNNIEVIQEFMIELYEQSFQGSNQVRSKESEDRWQSTEDTEECCCNTGDVQTLCEEVSAV